MVKKIQKGLVVVDYQGDAASNSCITKKDKLYDGNSTFYSQDEHDDSDEDDPPIKMFKTMSSGNEEASSSPSAKQSIEVSLVGSKRCKQVVDDVVRKNNYFYWYLVMTAFIWLFIPQIRQVNEK